MLPCAEEPQCGDPLQLWGAPGASGVRCRGDDRQVDDLVQSRCWAAVVAVAGSALSLISVCCDIYLSTPSDSATSCSEVDYVRAQRRQAQFGDHWTLLGLLHLRAAQRGPRLMEGQYERVSQSRELLYSVPAALCEEIARAATEELAERLSIPD